MSQLANQVAVVTGAGRGIGRAIALKFAARALMSCAFPARLRIRRKLPRKFAPPAGEPGASRVDVANGEGVTAAAEKILAEAGKVDILVNNAGVTRDGLLMRMSEADWDTVLATNLKGAFLMTKALTRPFIKQRSGRIINIASVIGLIGNAGQSNYAASKAGLIGFTKSVARELASRGITANVIAPGFVETDMTSGLNEQLRAEILKTIPLGQFGQPEDIAGAALFLAGPAGRFITGQVLTVDGGMVM